MMTEKLPMPAFTVREFENLLNLPENYAWKVIELGHVQAFRDSAGQLRISYPEASRYADLRREKKKKRMKSRAKSMSGV
jgi:hypothetical protein